MLRVSIITPCFNDGKYLMEAIESTQTSRQEGFCEHIVVDDGSTDAFTLELYKRLPALKIQVILAGKVGLGKARNIGIKAAKADYYLNLDADNKIRPEFPFEGVKILDEHPSVGVVYGDAQFFGREVKVYRPGPYELNKLLYHNYIDTCSLIRKKTWEDAGAYDEKEMLWEDWNFWLSIRSTQWEFKYVEKTWYDYRIREEASLRETAKFRGKEVENYIAKKHGHLYREGFKELSNKTLELEKAIHKLNENLKLQEKKIKQIKIKHDQERVNWISNAEKIREMLMDTEKQLQQSRVMQKSMENSLSWKVTKPFRFLSSLFRN